MSKTVNLGACTAYGIARKYGYTGTEEEWNALQNSLKNEASTYANSARSSASAALTSEQKAAASEANAKAYMDSAEESKNAAFSTTPEGYEANVQKLEDMDIQTATGESLNLVGTRAGGIKLDKIAGKSAQNQYLGKNLFNVLNNTNVSSGITTKIVNGIVSLSGTATSSYTNLLEASKFDNAIPSGTTITMSINKILDRDIVLTLTGGDLITIVKGKTSASLTLPSDKNSYWIYVSVTSGESLNISNLEIQIEIGDTATEYEPYVGCTLAPNPDYPQEIGSVGDDGSIVVTSCGRNLFMHNVAPLYSWGVVGEAYNPSLGMLLKAGTYTIKSIINEGEDHRIFCYFFDINKTKVVAKDLKVKDTTNFVEYLNGIVFSTGGIPSTFTLLEDYYVNFSGMDNEITKIMLEKGAVATTYEPYKSTKITIPLSEPLRSIGDIKDEIVIQDGKWGVLRRIGKYTLPNSGYSKEDSGISPYFYLDATNIIPASSNTILYKVISSKFINSNPYNVAGNVISLLSYQDKCQIRFRISSISTIDELTTWLSSNEITILYELATPTFEPFSDQTQFYGLSSFDGVTNIITDQTIEPTMEVEYGKSMVGAYTLENHNTSKRNEILLTDLQTAYLTTLSQEV